MAIDPFQVNEPTGEAVTSPGTWARTLDALRAVLTGDAQVATLLEKRRAAARAHTPPGGPAQNTPAHHLSADYTLLAAKWPDRLGLPYLGTRTPPALGLVNATARIA